jgi:hypothetical protein
MACRQSNWARVEDGKISVDFSGGCCVLSDFIVDKHLLSTMLDPGDQAVQESGISPPRMSLALDVERVGPDVALNPNYQILSIEPFLSLSGV